MTDKKKPRATKAKTIEATIVPAAAASTVPAELHGIEPALLDMPPSELANIAYIAQEHMNDLTAEFRAGVAKIKQREEHAKRVLAYRMSESKMRQLPHPRLAVKYESTPTRTKNEPLLLAVRKDFPDVDWKGAIDEIPVPATIEIKTNLTKIKKLITDFGDTEIAKRLKAATPEVPGTPVLTITLRADAMENVTSSVDA